MKTENRELIKLKVMLSKLLLAKKFPNQKDWLERKNGDKFEKRDNIFYLVLDSGNKKIC